MAEVEKKNFVGVRLSDEEIGILERIMDAMEPLTGRRNQSDALRYVLRTFSLEESPLGKAPSRAGAMA